MAKGVILGMLAETPLHPGAGQSAGVVDLPVARERATGLPHIPETGLKGALRQWAEERGGIDLRRLFGATDEGRPQSEGAEDTFRGAGELLISTARLLCLPVRRLDSLYAWVTTPYLLERLRRDSERVGTPLDPPMLDPKGSDLHVAEGPADQTVFLEEYSFTTRALASREMEGLARSLTPIVGAEQDVMERLLKLIAVMSDKEFVWFAENALPVDARNKLDDSKMSENLWYEETIPPDALFYSLILPRNSTKDANERFQGFFKTLGEGRYIQVGGNETVGHGWVQLKVHQEGG